MTALDDLIAACNLVQNDPHAAASTKQMAGKLKTWAPTVIPTPAVPATPVPVGALLFHDDFDGTVIDATKWDVKLRGQFVQTAVSVHDGLLDITAELNTVMPNGWQAGEIQGLPATAYTGPRYSECRAKVPAGAGTWAAPLWERDAPWGALGIENDTCEQLGKDPVGTYHVTVHNGPNESHGQVVSTGVDLAAAFHRYGCAMYPDRADYYFDGELVATIPSTALSAWKFTTTPTVPLVDLDMGGWGGTITVQPPVHLLVDYVKVWALA